MNDFISGPGQPDSPVTEEGGGRRKDMQIGNFDPHPSGADSSLPAAHAPTLRVTAPSFGTRNSGLGTRFLWILFALAAIPLSADPLANTVSVLKTLTGSSPLRATVDRQITNREKDKVKEQGAASVQVEMSGGSVSMTLQARDIDLAQRETSDPDKDKPRPFSSALKTIEPLELANRLDHARQLLSRIDGAKLLRHSVTTWEGRPAQLLELQLVVRLSSEEAKNVKESKATMKLWIGADGTPLASETSSFYRARILVLSFESKDQESRRYSRSGDHLIVSHDDSRSDGSFLGKQQNRRRVTTIRIES